MLALVIFIVVTILFYVVASSYKEEPKGNKIQLANNKQEYTSNLPKKELNIPSYVLGYAFFAILIGFAITLTINHFGKFQYLASYNPQPGLLEQRISGNTPVASITYVSPLGSEIVKINPSMDVYRVNYDFQYPDRLDYYISATFSDYSFIILFSVIFMAILLFIKNFKFKIT